MGIDEGPLACLRNKNGGTIFFTGHSMEEQMLLFEIYGVRRYKAGGHRYTDQSSGSASFLPGRRTQASGLPVNSYQRWDKN